MAAQQSKNQPVNLKQDTSLIEEPKKWQFKLGMFVAGHKLFFKRLFYFILFFINILILTNLSLRWIAYSTSEIAHQKMLQMMSINLIDYDNFRQKNRPVDLKILKIESVKSGVNQYDLVARVANNNQDWMAARFTYSFIVDGVYLPQQESYILPGKNKYLLVFGYASRIQPDKIELEITAHGWEKVIDTNRLQIYQSITIIQPQFKLNSEGLGSVKWTATNNSAYGFWEIGFQIILYNANHQIIGVNYLQDNRFKSLISKDYSLNWYENLPSVYETEVLVDVNVFDETVFMPLDFDGIQPVSPY